MSCSRGVAPAGSVWGRGFRNLLRAAASLQTDRWDRGLLRCPYVPTELGGLRQDVGWNRGSSQPADLRLSQGGMIRKI